MSATETTSLHLSQLVPNGRSKHAHQLINNPAQLYGVLLTAFPANTVSHHFGSSLEPSARGVLFRIDESVHSRKSSILIQSHEEPDWRALPLYFREEALDPLHPPQTKTFVPWLLEGQILRFRLRANPTRVVPGEELAPGRRSRGKVRPVIGEEAQQQWLSDRLASIAQILDARVIREGNRRVVPSAGGDTRLVSALFEGRLEVKDQARFAEVLSTGIGRGKAFGFGLLSIARV